MTIKTYNDIVEVYDLINSLQNKLKSNTQQIKEITKSLSDENQSIRNKIFNLNNVMLSHSNVNTIITKIFFKKLKNSIVKIKIYPQYQWNNITKKNEEMIDIYTGIYLTFNFDKEFKKILNCKSIKLTSTNVLNFYKNVAHVYINQCNDVFKQLQKYNIKFDKRSLNKCLSEFKRLNSTTYVKLFDSLI